MSEHWQPHADDVLIERGPVQISYDDVTAFVGRIWVKASCQVCPATTVMMTDGGESQLAYLAHKLAAYDCLGGEDSACKRAEVDQAIYLGKGVSAIREWQEPED